MPAAAKEGSKMSALELEDIIERAKRGDLSTDKVIIRALQDNLIDPKDIKNCGALENIRYIDMQTMTELTPAVKELNKLAKAADQVSPTLSQELKEAAMNTNLVLKRLNDQMANIQRESLSRSCDGRVL